MENKICRREVEPNHRSEWIDGGSSNLPVKAPPFQGRTSAERHGHERGTGDQAPEKMVEHPEPTGLALGVLLGTEVQRYILLSVTHQAVRRQNVFTPRIREQPPICARHKCARCAHMRAPWWGLTTPCSQRLCQVSHKCPKAPYCFWRFAFALRSSRRAPYTA